MLEQAFDRSQSGAGVAAAIGLGKLCGLVTDRQRIETVNEWQAHLEALRELAEKRAGITAKGANLKVVNGQLVAKNH